MDPRNDKNATPEGETDLDFYLKGNFHPDQVRVILKHSKKMDEEAIEKFINAYVDKLNKVQKIARKLLEKVERKYSYLPYESVVQKAYNYAKQHNFTDAEKHALLKLASKGDVFNTYNQYSNLKLSDMAKFFGFNTYMQTLNIGSKDYGPLHEIVSLYQSSSSLHQNIKSQLALYRNCAPEALASVFDKNKMDVYTHINPVFVALFLPKIEAIENRMLVTNLGRIVLQRAQAFTNKNIPLYDNLLQNELNNEAALTNDIVRDPNSLAYFSEDSPTVNMLKRFKIQVELWKNVLNLRNGKYYAMSGSSSDTDTINGLTSALNSYEWSVFDSPDTANVQDEGTILKRLLSVFSLRPTFTQISSIATNSAMGYSNWTGLARTSLIQIPIINVKLPTTQTYNGPIQLQNALSQQDFFIENKMLTPKNKSVIYSKDLVFFYANRRYQSIGVASLSSNFVYQNQTVQNWLGQTVVNNMPLGFGMTEAVGGNTFYLRSVVALYKPVTTTNIAVSSVALVVDHTTGLANGASFLMYNPLLANYMTQVNGAYQTNKAISQIPAVGPASGSTPGFNSLARECGTVFVYSKNPSS